MQYIIDFWAAAKQPRLDIDETMDDVLPLAILECLGRGWLSSKGPRLVPLVKTQRLGSQGERKSTTFTVDGPQPSSLPV